MSSKKRAFVMLFADIFLLCCLFLMLSSCVTREHSASQRVAEELISGSELRHMMNQARLSPGAANDYIVDHPTFAWLFDGSFVTYVN